MSHALSFNRLSDKSLMIDYSLKASSQIIKTKVMLPCLYDYR